MTRNEVLEARRYLRRVMVAAGLCDPKLLDQPLEAKLSDEERRALARQFTGTKDLSQIIIEEREENY